MSAAGWDGDKLPCLCNDCLRVVMLTKDQYLEQKDDNGLIACECGGDNGPCWCTGCVDTARRLLDGERSGDLLGFQSPGVVSWNVVGGLRK